MYAKVQDDRKALQKHKNFKILLKQEAYAWISCKRETFTVSMADVDHVAGCDCVGIASENYVEGKFVK